jgi:hypothetical protein
MARMPAQQTKRWPFPVKHVVSPELASEALFKPLISAAGRRAVLLGGFRFPESEHGPGWVLDDA